jgi:hypothetical protein
LEILDNEKYLSKIEVICLYSKDSNMDTYNHFIPILYPFLEMLNPQARVLLISPTEIQEINIEQVKNAYLANLSYLRLLWTWEWNIKSILHGVLDTIISERNPEYDYIKRLQMINLVIQPLSFSPYLLQILYSLENLHPGDNIIDLSSSRFFQELSEIKVILPDIWILNGKQYGINDIFQKTYKFSSNSNYVHTCMALREGVMSSLINISQNGHLSLGVMGKSLITRLPRGCKDTGMLNRWITPGEKIGTLDDIPAMDRWSKGILQKIKRVNVRKEIHTGDFWSDMY